MKLEKYLNVKEVVAIYLYANTPRYLYRHLRRIESISELSAEASLDSLVEEYNKRTTKEKRSEVDVAIAYALLITITFLEYRKALAAFDQFDLSRLDWGKEIKDIFINTSPISNFISISQKSRIPAIERAISDSSTSALSLSQPNSQNIK